ncbi:MAG: caspase family protein [Elusimicrobia bacterium]|nr:caspase family protein [Elusimicrobiota bacterium]
MTPDGRRLDVIKGTGAQTIAFPDFPSAFDAAVTGAIGQTQRSLEDSLFNSAPLLELAKARAGTAGAPVAAAAPAPAPRAEARAASDVDALPSRRAARDPKAYAIVIGIEKYRQKLPAAEFAAADARAMSAYLTKVMGYPEENVVTLVDDQAAKSDFEKYFDKWLPNNVEPGSTVMVYYSGHGAPNPRTADAYLVPYDGDPTFLEETGYPLKRMYAALAKLPAKKVLVALDSCFSGAGGRSVIAKGSRPLVVDIRRDLALPKNMSVLAASADDETSSTYDEKGHGLFTYFVLKGIRDENALRSDGSLDVRGLYGYVKEQVRRVARKRYNNEQTPQLLAPKE